LKITHHHHRLTLLDLLLSLACHLLGVASIVVDCVQTVTVVCLSVDDAALLGMSYYKSGSRRPAHSLLLERMLRLLRQPAFLLLLVAASSSCCLVTQAASETAASPVLTSYESVRALDEYGNARQLDYALQAATQQSNRLVMLLPRPRRTIAGSQEEEPPEVWLVTLQAPPPPHHRPSNVSPTSSSSASSVLHALTLPPHNGAPHAPQAWLVTTGWQGDARWLVQEVRAYVQSLWQACDIVTPPASALAAAVADLLQLFWSYPLEHSVKSPWLRGLLQDHRGEPRADTRWGRPLGLVVAVVVLDANALPVVYHVLPSGSVEHVASTVPLCLGSQSAVVQTALQVAWSEVSDNADDEKLEAAILHVLKENLGPLQGQQVSLQVLGGHTPSRLLFPE
jgi:20S proteasome alpha/beta subunit